MAALTPEQVREIRINPKGKTWVEFMVEFDCSRDTVWKARTYRSHRGVRP